MTLIWSMLAGLLASTAYHPLHLWPALFIGIAWLYQLNKERPTTRRLLINFLFGFSFQIFSLYWVGTYVGSLAWIALVLMQASFFIILSFTRGPIGFALSWIVFEFILRSFPFGGFGWSRIGYALTESPLNYLYPRISIVGVAFASVLLTALVADRNYRFVLATLISLLLIGLIPVNVSNNGSIRVALVQGGQTQKMDNTFENANAALKKHFTATEEITSGSVDLVIWPENVIAHDPLEVTSTKKNLSSEISRIKAPILVNANMNDGTVGSVLLGAGKVQIYSKRYLTPFGEFVPFKSLVEKLSDKAGNVIDYIPGRTSYLFKSSKGTFRTLICYELLSDKQARAEMSDSDFIVTQTNNATYFKTWQLEQEQALAQARSAESSRQSAYVSTTGITSIIDERGRIVKSIPKYTNQVLVATVIKRQGATFASKYGNWIEYFLLVLWLLFLIASWAGRANGGNLLNRLALNASNRFNLRRLKL